MRIERVIREAYACPVPAMSTTAMAKTVALRRNVIHELISTEKSYAESLASCITLYLRPLRATRIIKETSVEIIFGRMNCLHSLSETFVVQLEKLEKEVLEVACVSKAFASVLDNFGVFVEYANNFTRSSVKLQKLRKGRNRGFKLFCNAAATNPLSGGRTLEDFLIMPIQRVPRYLLLLSEIKKATEASHRDIKGLHEVIDRMQLIADQMNSAARDATEWQKILQLEKKLYDGENLGIAVFGRKLIKEGKLFKVSRTAGDREHEVFLFNDACAYARVRSGFLVLNHLISFQDGFEIIDLPNAFGQPENRFEIRSLSKEMTLYAPTAELKEEWVRAFAQVLPKHRISTIIADKPASDFQIFVADTTSKSCKICKNEFGLIRRRHVCKKW